MCVVAFSGNEAGSADAPAGEFPRGGTDQEYSPISDHGISSFDPARAAYSYGAAAVATPKPALFGVTLDGSSVPGVHLSTVTRGRHVHLHAHPHRRPGADGDYTPALFLRTNSTSD